MARQKPFGELLNEARRRNGMSLADASRALRIRQDILRAIEEGDFSRMPPRGYTRNMVIAYARLVGLDPRKISQLYNDQAYAYEVGKVRSSNNEEQFQSRRRSSSGTDMGENSSRSRHPESTQRSRSRNQDSVHPSRGRAVPRTQYTNLYASPAKTRPGVPPLAILIAAVVVVILIILCIVLFSRTGATMAEPNDQTTPITGLTDTSGNATSSSNTGTTQPTDTTGADATQNAAAQLPPTSAHFSYSVKDGEQAYIEVYLDGSANPDVAETVTGPATKEYDVTGTLRFTTTNPEAVTLMLDGATVEPQETNSGTGIYNYSVDFTSILRAWQQEHGSTTQSSDGSTAGAQGDGTTTPTA